MSARVEHVSQPTDREDVVDVCDLLAVREADVVAVAVADELVADRLVVFW